MEPIATLHTNLKGKFGLPRQGMVSALRGTIVFEEPYRNPDALRGLEDFSHLWILWEFSEVRRKREEARARGEDVPFQPTVRPPRLGGNKRFGVFATRSPNRPNPIAISAVKIASIDLHTPDGPVIVVEGADLMDGTPIYDIKPYIPYSDAIPDAAEGFTAQLDDLTLDVSFPDDLLSRIPEEHRAELCGVLRNDPRPQYQRDPERVYGLTYLSWDIRFRIDGTALTVVDVVPVR